MKRLFAGPVLALSLALGASPIVACAALPDLNKPLVPAAAQPIVTVGAYDIEAAYSVFGGAYKTLVEGKQLTGAPKAQAKAVLQKAYAALRVVRQARRAGDAATVAAKLAEFKGLLNTLRAQYPVIAARTPAVR